MRASRAQHLERLREGLEINPPIAELLKHNPGCSRS
jgi:hypothetical protein